ncbi:MAG: hypothetical protein M3O22_08625, partial [Pseudomonadota bacterium]|nr:hypothetical protein [Pseudomonadota bacterium]
TDRTLSALVQADSLVFLMEALNLARTVLPCPAAHPEFLVGHLHALSVGAERHVLRLASRNADPVTDPVEDILRLSGLMLEAAGRDGKYRDSVLFNSVRTLMDIARERDSAGPMMTLAAHAIYRLVQSPRDSVLRLFLQSWVENIRKLDMQEDLSVTRKHPHESRLLEASLEKLKTKDPVLAGRWKNLLGIRTVSPSPSLRPSRHLH